MVRYPGEMLESLGKPVASGARGLVTSVGGGLRGFGDQIQEGLDKPANAVGLKYGPFRIIHYPIAGLVKVVERAGTEVVDAIDTTLSSVTTGLDTVPATFDPATLKLKPPVDLPRLPNDRSR